VLPIRKAAACSAASRSSFRRTWAWVCRKKPTLAWPIRSLITFGLMPALDQRTGLCPRSRESTCPPTVAALAALSGLGFAGHDVFEHGCRVGAASTLGDEQTAGGRKLDSVNVFEPFDLVKDIPERPTHDLFEQFAPIDGRTVPEERSVVPGRTSGLLPRSPSPVSRRVCPAGNERASVINWICTKLPPT
jgi:hypothetical protein